MPSAFTETSRRDVDKILEDVTSIYEKLSGQPYGGLKESDHVAPIPAGVDAMEFLDQEYRYLMGLVNAGALEQTTDVQERGGISAARRSIGRRAPAV